MTPCLVPVKGAGDILPRYRETPIGRLLEYQNLDRPLETCPAAQLLVGMCMDNRKALRIPANYAYILRAGGANLRRVEFKVSFAIAIGGVRAVALIGHDDCGMVGLTGRREKFIRGLVGNGGWDPVEAARHFDENAGVFEIRDAAGFVHAEAARLRSRYPGVMVAPLFYLVGDGTLCQVEED